MTVTTIKRKPIYAYYLLLADCIKSMPGTLDFFIKKCRHDINKLNFNRNIKFSNLSSEERAALENLSKRKDLIVKAADKGGALVVWRADLYQKEALRQLSDTSFYAKVDKDLTSTNQQIAKSTINDLIV